MIEEFECPDMVDPELVFQAEIPVENPDMCCCCGDLPDEVTVSFSTAEATGEMKVTSVSGVPGLDRAAQADVTGVMRFNHTEAEADAAKKDAIDLGSYVRQAFAVADAKRACRRVPGLIPQRRGTIKRMARIGRNDPCPCGSGKKVKRCCL